MGLTIRARAAGALFRVARRSFFRFFVFLFAPVAHDEEFVANKAHDESCDAADCLSREVVDLIQEFRLSDRFCAHASGHNRTAKKGLHKDDCNSQNDIHDAGDDDVVGAVEGLFSVEHEGEDLSDDRTDQETDEVRSRGISEHVFERAEVEAVEFLIQNACFGSEFQKRGQDESDDKLRAAADETEQCEHNHLAHVFVGFDFVNESLKPCGKFDFLFAGVFGCLCSGFIGNDFFACDVGCDFLFDFVHNFPSFKFGFLISNKLYYI